MKKSIKAFLVVAVVVFLSTTLCSCGGFVPEDLHGMWGSTVGSHENYPFKISMIAQFTTNGDAYIEIYQNGDISSAYEKISGEWIIDGSKVIIIPDDKPFTFVFKKGILFFFDEGFVEGIKTGGIKLTKMRLSSN